MLSRLNLFRKIALALSAVIIITQLVQLYAGTISGHDAFKIIVIAALTAVIILIGAKSKDNKPDQ